MLDLYIVFITMVDLNFSSLNHIFYITSNFTVIFYLILSRMNNYNIRRLNNLFRQSITMHDIIINSLIFVLVVALQNYRLDRRRRPNRLATSFH